MYASVRALTVAAGAVLVLGGLAMANTAVAANAAETLYAELAKLPPAERMEKLIEGAKKEEKLVTVPLFNGPLERDHTKIFRTRYPWMKLETQSMNTEESTERLIAEETAGKHLTDQINVTMPDLDPMLTRDMLARFPTKSVERILPQYAGFIDKEGGGRWLPWTWSEHGISYNTSIIKKEDEPKSYMDLCHARFKGTVSYDPGEPKWVVGVLQMMGEAEYTKFAQCVAKNEPVIMKGHTQRMQLMLVGDHGVQGDNFLYTGVMAQKKNPTKANFAIAFGAPIMARASVAVINKTTARPYSAGLWTEWQLSDESQQFVYEVFRGPLTMQHAYITAENNLFVYGIVPSALTNKASDIWKAAFSKK